jgi:hypothetical protein
VERFRELATVDRFQVHQTTDDASDADLILFPQCHMLPRDWRLSAIRTHALTKRYPGKVMVYDERDRPWCSLPGVYVSMSANRFDERYERAWAYAGVDAVRSDREPDLLFSFVGSPSHRCRTPLFGLHAPDGIVECVRGFTFYDPTSRDFEARRARFEELLSRSRFVLCPRGKGTSSIRLYEALAAGRVPVIISDDWVAPKGPNWESFTIRWPEGRTDGLVQALQDADHDWPSMSAAASEAYDSFFTETASFHRIVDLCSDLRDNETWRGFKPRIFNDPNAWAAGADVFRSSIVVGARKLAKRLARRIRKLRRA